MGENSSGYVGMYPRGTYNGVDIDQRRRSALPQLLRGTVCGGVGV